MRGYQYHLVRIGIRDIPVPENAPMWTLHDRVKASIHLEISTWIALLAILFLWEHHPVESLVVALTGCVTYLVTYERWRMREAAIRVAVYRRERLTPDHLHHEDDFKTVAEMWMIQQQ